MVKICLLPRHALIACVFSLLFTTACAGPRWAACPAEGGDPWVQVESRHYVLDTDLSARAAARAIEYLELTRAALLAAGWPGANIDSERTEAVAVYALADSGQFRALFPRFEDGVYVRSTASTMVVLYGSPQTWDRRFALTAEGKRSMLRQQIAHDLSSSHLVRQPRWLIEGLAHFVETVQLSPDGHSATVGAPHQEAVATLRSFGSLPVGQTFDWGKRSSELGKGELPALSATSWLLVHWLFEQNANAFAQLQLRLARGEDPDQAFATAFPGLDAAKLEKALLSYLKRGAYRELTVEVPPVDTKAVTRRMTDADAHAARAGLSLIAAQMVQDGAKERLALGMTEVKAALAKDPTNVNALAWGLSTLPQEQQLPRVQAAVKAHPERGRAWFLLASLLKAEPAREDEREEALRNAVARDPRVATYAHELASFLTERLRFEEAMPFARKAVQLGPWSPNILDTFAAAAAGVGQCEDAISAEQRAIDFLPEDERSKKETTFRKRLAEYQATCKPAEAPTPD